MRNTAAEGAEPDSRRTCIHSYSYFGQNGGHRGAILAELFAEPLLQFLILHSDHENAGRDRECCERPADGQACAYAPGQHLAEMAQVDGVAHAGANACGYQVLPAVVMPDLGQSAELDQTELPVREFIEDQAGTE